LARVPNVRLTGHRTRRLANHASFVFWGIEAEALLLRLDLSGIAASAGSACSSDEGETSPVLRAMGLDTTWARGNLRLTLGRENTMEDVDQVIAVLPPIIEELRALSPLSVAAPEE
jgi:cysteine desulfurase